MVKKHVSEVTRSKKFLINELKKLNIDYIDTYANFFTLNLKNNKLLENIFKKKRNSISKRSRVKGFEKYSRFSLGSVSQAKQILNVIKYVS